MKILDVMPGTKDTEIDDMYPKQPVLFLESIFYAPWILVLHISLCLSWIPVSIDTKKYGLF